MLHRRSVTFLALLSLALGAWALTAAPALATPLPPQIHTVAGSGSCSGPNVSGGLCDNVSATSAVINDARAVSALPGGGFLYVDADAPFALAGGVAPAGIIREVTPKGKVITVAGNGTTADAPDGTLAVNSGLNGPVAVAALPGGGFLITEYNSGVVRMVSPGDPTTATIATIATGLSYPTDAEVTPSGQVLIAASGNGLIWELSAAAPGASMSVVAGGGSCDDRSAGCEGAPAGAVALHVPVSVSPDAGGDGGFLIAEADTLGASAIRQVSPGGTFTTVAGVPGQGPGYSGDGGPATSALLNAPEQVLSTPGGGFLIADTHNEVVRQVSPQGIITTLAGNGMATYAGDGGDATAASFENPAGVALYPYGAGDFLVADENDGAIREVTFPPVTTISFGPVASMGANGWFWFPVTATVTTTERASLSCESDPVEPPPVFAAILPGCPLNGASGTQISGDGIHIVWAAAANSFGDDENPVSATVKIDGGTPSITCGRAPSFAFGSGRHKVSAKVSDSISGPVQPVVAYRVKTTRAGHFSVSLRGVNNAGRESFAACAYTVRPRAMKPVPGFGWAVLSGRASASFRRLVLVRVPAAAAVNVSCSGGGCPFRTAKNITGAECNGRPCVVGRHTHYRRARTVVLTPLFAGHGLSARASLVVSVTEANTLGRVWELALRAGRRPALAANCLEPGSSRPGQGCAAPVKKK